MFIRTRKLVLLALGLMILLVTLGGVQIYLDFKEESEKLAEYDELVLSMTPEECIAAYVKGYVEEDRLMLRALHANKNQNYDFSFKKAAALPVQLVEPYPEVWPGNGDRPVSVTAYLQSVNKSGVSFIGDYIFVFVYEGDPLGGRWQILSVEPNFQDAP